MIVMDVKMKIVRGELSYFCMTFKIVVQINSIPVNTAVLISEKLLRPVPVHCLHDYSFHFMSVTGYIPVGFLNAKILKILMASIYDYQILRKQLV